MTPEFPKVQYAPQANEPGWTGPTVALLDAAIVEAEVPGAFTLDVAGPNGTYRVRGVRLATAPTPGYATVPAGVPWPAPAAVPASDAPAVDAGDPIPEA